MKDTGCPESAYGKESESRTVSRYERMKVRIYDEQRERRTQGVLSLLMQESQKAVQSAAMLACQKP